MDVRLRPVAAFTVACLLSTIAVLLPGAVATPAAADSATDPVTFNTNWSGGDWGNTVYPSNQQCPSGTYTVPAGITLVRITAVGGVGAPGGDASIDPTGKLSWLGRNGGGNGGLATKVSGIVSVAPGAVFNVVVATNGGSPASPTDLNWKPAGGWGGGGVSSNGNAPVSGGGGGASYVTTAPLVGGGTAINDFLGTQCKPASNVSNWGTDNTSQMVVVAGGGGGGGNASTFGDGGGGGNAGLLGGVGGGGSNGSGAAGGYGGGGGGQTSGGATGNLGGDSPSCSQNRSAGYFLMGGFAGHDSFTLAGSGAGGSGLWGGGAGGRSCASAGAAGGGGGSSYITPAALNQSSSNDDSAVPYVRFEPIMRGTTTTVTASANPAYSNQAVTLTATVTPTGGMLADLPQVPTGTVSFLEGPFNTNIGSAVVVDGVATLTRTFSTGSHAIRGLFTSDALFGGSVSPIDSFTLQIEEAPASPAVTANPTDATVGYGSACTFSAGLVVGCSDNVYLTAAATGHPTPTVQWQYSTDNGATYSNVLGATSATYTLNPPVSYSGRKYRAVFTNSGGTATTTAATLTVNPAALTIHANDKSMPFGGSVPTLDAAYGDPQFGSVFRNGDTASSLGGTLACTTTATSSSATGAYPITCSGRTSTNYTISYTPGILTVNEAFQTIQVSTTAPSHALVGDTYTPVATGGASGNPVTVSIDTDLSTAEVCTLTDGVVHFNSAGPYGIGHCYINFNQAGNALYPAAPQVQQHALVYPVPPSVTLQPVSQTVNLGDSVTFAAEATGSEMWIQWYVSGDGGVTFQPEIGATSTSLTFTPESWQSGNRYKVAFTNRTGPSTVQTAWSDVVTLTVVDPLVITLQPSDPYPVLDCCGYTTTTGFSAAVTGSPKPTAQWQVSTDGGATFTDVAGAATPLYPYWAGGHYTNYEINAAGMPTGRMYRVAFTNANGTVYSDAATLTVWSLVAITGQPTAQTANAGDTATFTASASGGPVPTAQWQVSTDGGVTFGDIDGATSPTLTLTDVTAAMDGNRYRAVFTNPNQYRDASNRLHDTSVAVTDAAALTVHGPPTITTDPAGVSVNAQETATFAAAASGAPTPTVAWQVSTDGGDSWSDVAGATTTTLSFATTGTQSGNRYRAAFTNEIGTSYTEAATLTVQRIPLTITAGDESMTYGGVVPSFGATYDGFVNGQGPSVLSGTLACGTTPPATSGTGAGDHVITCGGVSSPDYAIAFAPGTLDVAAAQLSASVSGSQTYGGEPSFVVTGFAGLVNDEPASVVTGDLDCETDATAVSAVGTYDVTSCSGLGADDYAISHDLGAVEVSAAPLVISVGGTQTYGGAPTYAVSDHSGFVNDEDSTLVTGELACVADATSASHVGTYPITSCSGLSADNYDVSFSDSTLAVGPAPLTITASSISSTYGVAPPAVTPSYAGFVNGDAPAALTASPTCATTVTPSTPAGAYVGADTCTGAADADYAISYGPGTATVGRAQLTVTADNKSRLFGAPNGLLTATISGFANGQTLATSGVTGSASCVTTATASSVGGAYPITCALGTLAAPNYTFAFAPGTLTVTYTGGTCLTGTRAKKLVVAAGESLCLAAGFSIVGSITVEPGGALDVRGGATQVSIGAPVTTTGATAVRLCGARIAGSVSISGTTGPVTVGSTATPVCVGNAIAGSATLRGNAGGVVVKNNAVVGNLTISDTTGTVPPPDTGAVAVAGNTVRGRTTIS